MVATVTLDDKLKRGYTSMSDSHDHDHGHDAHAHDEHEEHAVPNDPMKMAVAELWQELNGFHEMDASTEYHKPRERQKGLRDEMKSHYDNAWKKIESAKAHGKDAKQQAIEEVVYDFFRPLHEARGNHGAPTRDAITGYATEFGIQGGYHGVVKHLMNNITGEYERDSQDPTIGRLLQALAQETHEETKRYGQVRQALSTRQEVLDSLKFLVEEKVRKETGNEYFKFDPSAEAPEVLGEYDGQVAIATAKYDQQIARTYTQEHKPDHAHAGAGHGGGHGGGHH